MVRFFVISLVLGLVLSAPLADTPLAQDTEEESEAEEALAEEEPAEAEVTRQDLLESLSEVRGKRGRRLFKTAYWAAGLEGDMKRIYDDLGYPSGRYREEKAGVTLEKWTYFEAGKQFIFRDTSLTRTREFNPGSALGIYLK